MIVVIMLMCCNRFLHLNLKLISQCFTINLWSQLVDKWIIPTPTLTRSLRIKHTSNSMCLFVILDQLEKNELGIEYHDALWILHRLESIKSSIEQKLPSANASSRLQGLSFYVLYSEIASTSMEDSRLNGCVRAQLPTHCNPSYFRSSCFVWD